MQNATHSASAWGHLTVVQLLIERGCAFAVKNTAGFTPADFAYSHSVKAALEAFGRVQHELRRRRWRAASSNHSGASTEDLGLAQLRTHTQGQGSNTSPRMFDDSVLYEDDLEEMGSFSHGGSLSRKSSNSDAAMPPKVERLLGTALPNAAHQTPASQAGSGGGGGSSSTFSGNSPFFQPQWQPSTSSPRGFAARSGSISDTGSVPPLPLGIARPQLNPYPLTPNTRQADPSTPMKHSGPLPQPVREDSIGSSPGMVPSASSASVSSNMGCIANKMILQDQAAMSSYLSRAKASSGGSRRN
ncbi:hypothetical protein K437DRAFT_127381 [Tilletiaria anomala UBC 951]|uniref:Uncharacterized protein n=1 Tax=Tilletiaria anomala (strain ATCC 24038 / CBS 436.72 / UBC 951) TaxID=1037660 RepID=A0A066VXE2_TILAU|nr:uncharacterized protein K437DRAFT_127381 [Tilletiaria anomala UBC 951]KDN44948.1 hypothetical protein K437DRAFT_127381 [Tilletiaria anomala UBC 951]